MLGLSLAALDQMILATAAASISGELGGIAQAPWLFTANLLTSSSSMPIWGKLGDLYGRRRVFQSAIAIFVVSSLFAASSETMPELVVCRLLQGLGGGGLLTLPNALIGDIAPPRQRAAYLAFNASVWACVGLAGPPLGGFLVDGPGWRWMFYLNVPLGALAAGMIQAGYRLPRERVEHSVDFTGAALLVGSVGSLILYTSWAGTTLGFASPPALALVVASALLGVAFVGQERRAREPIVDLALLALPGVRAPIVTTAIFGLANFAMAVFIPWFSIAVNGTSATEAGLALAPLPVGLFVMSVFAGRRSAITGRYRRYTAVGLALYMLGLALMMTMEAETPRWQFWLYSFVVGLGSGSVNPMVMALLQNSASERHLGVISSLPTFARAVAQTIGMSLLGTWTTLRLGEHLARGVVEAGLSAESLAAAAESPVAIHGLAGPLRAVAVEGYRLALTDAFAVMLAIMFAAFLASGFMRDPGRSR